MKLLPIESAPKNRRILFFYPVLGKYKNYLIFGKWNENKRAKKPEPHWANDLSQVWGSYYMKTFKPTHWADIVVEI